MHSLTAGALTLEPQTAAHAEDMFELLREPALYEYLDDEPPASADALRQRFARLESRRSADGTEHWLNWVIRHQGRLIGYVQATVQPAPEGCVGWVAYVLGRAFWGHGHATLAVRALVDELVQRYGVTRLQASVDPRNRRSIALLERLGFSPTDPLPEVQDGEPARDLVMTRGVDHLARG